MTEQSCEPEGMIELIEMLLAERADKRTVTVPGNPLDRWNLLRALMNTREPAPAPDDMLALQDNVLARIHALRETTHVSNLSHVPLDERMALWQGDITTLAADAIVNAANSKLLGCFVPGHRCIDNAIHTFAGMQLRLACNDIMSVRVRDEPVGTATVTSAFNLPAAHVIHTVGPFVFDAPTMSHVSELASCYASCLEAAAERGFASIAFCCISTGEFRFPHEQAAEIAVRSVKDFLATDTTLETVVFNVFTDEDRRIYERLLMV
ncbi:protein-ADP-ribose hydrolase [Raoultibacter phocaeensis]|uniref:protein-ADP-ribose hydrolase n=1 Tax=Raoultibacter phocaeensis TaxID=2479841 RepID=UPI00111A6F67|nr:protein-ADP-ribose hydrolase [Raoultibacter phocaeensis]